MVSARVSPACRLGSCFCTSGLARICIVEGHIRTRISRALSTPPTRGLRLTPLSMCSDPLQDGATPLHLAAERDASKIAELLLEKNADANAHDEVGEAWWWGEDRALWLSCLPLVRADVAGNASVWVVVPVRM